MTKDKIIEKLLKIISDYQTDGILKEKVLYNEVIDYGNAIKIIKLITKGEVGKGTPFYSGSTDTIIVAEYVQGNETFDAEILFSEEKQLKLTVHF